MKTLFQTQQTRLIFGWAVAISLLYVSCEAKLKRPFLRPFKLMFLNDGSGSMERSGHSPVQSVEFHPVIERMRESGGELGIGSITGQSDRPIKRIAFPKPDLTKPVREESSNPYIQKILDAEFETKQKTWQEQIGDLLNDAYDFLEGIFNDIHTQKPAGKTDVYAALSRAGIFLCEEGLDQVFGKYLIIYSDLEDNVGADFVEFSCDIEVLLVNGAKNARLLDDLGIAYLRFESVSSAARYIIDREEQWAQKFLVYFQPNNNSYDFPL